MIKDIVVHLAGTLQDEASILHAEALAGLFDAHLRGLHVHQLPEIVAITEPGGSIFLRELLEASEKSAQAVAAGLRTRLGKAGALHELKRLDVFQGNAGIDAAAEVRLSDLFVGMLPRDGGHIEITVLFQSGRPCYFVPKPDSTPTRPDNIFIAWKNSREAARALADAMPFLMQAKRVVVGLAEEPIGGEVAGGEIGRYLSRHGISAEINAIEGWSDTGEGILGTAKESLADMLVMGAFGHSRFTEWLLGGVTRHVLKNAEIPVLMVH